MNRAITILLTQTQIMPFRQIWLFVHRAAIVILLVGFCNVNNLVAGERTFGQSISEAQMQSSVTFEIADISADEPMAIVAGNRMIVYTYRLSTFKS